MAPLSLYVIYSAEASANDAMGEPLYWCNEEGSWFGIESATVYTQEERDAFGYMPMPDGVWVVLGPDIRETEEN